MFTRDQISRILIDNIWIIDSEISQKRYYIRQLAAHNISTCEIEFALKNSHGRFKLGAGH